MSLLDDYIESSEAAHGTSTVQYGADALVPINGFDGHDNVRVRFNSYFKIKKEFKQCFTSWKLVTFLQGLDKSKSLYLL